MTQTSREIQSKKAEAKRALVTDASSSTRPTTEHKSTLTSLLEIVGFRSEPQATGTRVGLEKKSVELKKEAGTFHEKSSELRVEQKRRSERSLLEDFKESFGFK